MPHRDGVTGVAGTVCAAVRRWVEPCVVYVMRPACRGLARRVGHTGSRKHFDDADEVKMVHLTIIGIMKHDRPCHVGQAVVGRAPIH